MIARISGTLIDKSVTHIIVDANGIGYRIFVPLTTFYELPETDQPVTLHIHTHVKEDSINLFGFYSVEDKEVFQSMISVTGIGPKLAINILSGIATNDLINAVSYGNLSRLVGIPGVGRKIAERMILELKDKLTKFLPEKKGYKVGDHLKEEDQLKVDAFSALINLGYKNNAVRDAVDKVIQSSSEEISTLDVLLKRALKILSG